MGIYVNPGFESMESAVSSEIYIDKTGILKILNKHLGTEKRYFAVSRARRFGKSMAAGMIEAYYSSGCDSRALFEPYEIAGDPDFEKHLNKYNVLHFDAAVFFNAAKNMADVIPDMDAALLSEMQEEFPYLEEIAPKNTAAAINCVYKREGRKFIIIIDEYDCIVRDDPENEGLIKDYLRYLRGFFKTEDSKKFLALGYITGILPIKKVNGESALNNFTEYTMTSPKELMAYFGFTEEEVQELCRRYNDDIKGVREWYDGYYMYEPVKGEIPEDGGPIMNNKPWEAYGIRNKQGQYEFPDEAGGIYDKDGSIHIINGKAMKLCHMYNPNSLVESFMHSEFSSFWKNTGSFDSLRQFIELNYAGLKDDIVMMLAGGRVAVNIKGFQNDLTHFKKKDDVLTCLIHMGYLGYDARTEETFIPNREVADVFEAAISTGDWDDVADSLNNSNRLLRATLDMDERTVAKVIAESHQDYSSIINFHDENALALAIMVSYYTARKHYYVKRELPAGRGFADIAFIPKHEGEYPALIVELKWNRSAKAAIKQIRDRTYEGALSSYKGKMLLVGINYTRKSGKYSCRITS